MIQALGALRGLDLNIQFHFNPIIKIIKIKDSLIK